MNLEGLYGLTLARAWKLLDGGQTIPLALNGYRVLGGAGVYKDLREVGDLQWPTGAPRAIRVRHPNDIAGTGATEIDVLAWSRKISGDGTPEAEWALRVHTVPLDTSGATFTVFGDGVEGVEFWDILEARVTRGAMNVGDIGIDRDGDGGLTPADSRIVIAELSGVSYNAGFYVPPGWMATISSVFLDQLSGAGDNYWAFYLSDDRDGSSSPESLVRFTEQKLDMIQWEMHSAGAMIENQRLRFVSNAKNTETNIRSCVSFRKITADAQPARVVTAMI